MCYRHDRGAHHIGGMDVEKCINQARDQSAEVARMRYGNNQATRLFKVWIEHSTIWDGPK
jgi:hypothetical protein